MSAIFKSSEKNKIFRKLNLHFFDKHFSGSLQGSSSKSDPRHCDPPFCGCGFVQYLKY